MTEQDKVTVDDIIGIVKTEEPTDSVEEVRKLRGRGNETAKRFNIEFDGHQYFLVIDENNERCLARLDTRIDALAWLEMYKRLSEENEQLKKTNQELYDFRLVLNALLFNEWAETGKYEVYKSQRHHDGEPCFDGEWFIVVAILPSGQVTNHYHIKYWDYFKIPSYERVKDEFDGHTSSVVLLRYEKVI